MAKFFNIKAAVLSVFIAVAVILPSVLHAQKSDGFFNDFDNEELYADRAGITIGGSGISPQGIGEPAPIGGGMLVLVAAGAGYAVLRRKSIKGIKGVNVIIMAIVLLLGMTQCRKNLDTIQDDPSNKVHITLRVENQSRVVIDTAGAITPSFATVTFENGDIMYVGYNKTYVGSLSYSNGNFTGDIDISQTVDDEPLYFYFLGGKGFTPTISGNTATLDISDQVVKYPVINFGHSVEVYPSATGDYTARLLNKCAIVKFHVTKPAGYDQAGTCITGMNNLLTVNFDHTAVNTDEGFTYSQINDGAITLPTKNGDVWAILLPQEELSEGGDMSVFSGRHKGIRPAMNEIKANDFIPTPYELNLNTEFQPTGTLSGLFKVNADGKMVRFASGNLKATTTDGWATWTWGFMDTQYYYETKGDVGANYANRTEVSLFGWATSGYNLRGAESSNYFYKPNSTGKGTASSYAPRINEITDITGAYAKGDWGYNRITGNAYYQWRCLTKDEWDYLKVNHTMGWTKIPASNNGNRGYGLMILPYGASGTIKSSYSLSEWADLEAQGAVFFAVCGCRTLNGSNYSNIGGSVDNDSYIWTSTCQANNGDDYMANVKWAVSTITVSKQSGGYGCCVRLVCE